MKKAAVLAAGEPGVGQAAKRQTGIETDTDLIEFALRRSRLEDNFATCSRSLVARSTEAEARVLSGGVRFRRCPAVGALRFAKNADTTK